MFISSQMNELPQELVDKLKDMSGKLSCHSLLYKLMNIRSRLDRSVELLYKRCNSVPVG